MEETPTQSNATPVWSHGHMGWLIGGAVAVALLAGVAGWFLSGPKIWTDGAAVRISDRGSRVREVVWTRPTPLDGFASDEQVYEPSLSPDGTELYFVRGKAGQNAKIYVSLRRNNAWTLPAAVVAVNGSSDSLGPRVTADGNYLLFYSNRPGGFGGYDIWAAPRTAEGWGEPFNLGPEVNSEFNEFNPDPTPDGRRLFFATNRMAAKREQNEAWRSTIRETVSSDYDIWMADRDASGAVVAPITVPSTQASTQPAAKLAYRHAREVLGINTPYTEGASCMSPAGDFLYFASNRPGGSGKFDIYRTRVHGDDFGPVENVGLPINSGENEADPALAYNGFRMFFSSDRPGADGRYRLLASDSREVYPERQIRPMPQLGWSWWLLIISLVVLIPLLLMMRGWEDQRFSMIQKCLLMSLLVHALITFLLSFVAVTQKMTQYVRQEMQMEVAINLGDSRGVDETLAIRSQMSGDLPVSSAAPQSLTQTKVETEAVEAPATVAMAANEPVARAAAGGIVLAAPHANTAAPQERVAKVMPGVGVESPAVDIARPTLDRVAQNESTPVASTAGKAGERTADTTNNAISAAQSASTKIDLAAGPSAPDRTSSVDMAVVPTRAGISGSVSDIKAAAVAVAAASSNGPIPAADGLLPHVSRSNAVEPVLDSTRVGPTTQAVGAIAKVVESDTHQSVEIAGTPKAVPSTMPSTALAVASIKTQPAVAEALGHSELPRTDASATSGSLIEAVPSASRIAVAKVAASEANELPKMMAGSAGKAADPQEISSAAAPGMFRVADIKPSTAAASPNGSSVSAAPMQARVAQIPVAGSPRGVKPEVAIESANGPALSGPVVALSGIVKTSGNDATPTATAAPGKSVAHPAQGPNQIGVPHSIDILPAPVVAVGKSLAGGRSGPEIGGVMTAPAQLASAQIKPEVSVATLSGPLGPGKSVVPDLPFIRAPEQRQPMLEQFGGTKESEDAVGRGLAYLDRVQEDDGHWTRIEADQPRRRNVGRRGQAGQGGQNRGSHDMACTGFAVLAFLGHDETPDKPGPYREAVTKGVEYLIAQQNDDGDLRGASRFKGGGSDSANMYDHGIATYALAECAIMTHDPRATEAAIKGAQFIVAAQNQESGGWRYSPNESGDSSVFGWQIMALHSAEQVGFAIPTDTIDGAKRYIASCGQGRYKMMAGYQPHGGPTPPMTAELLFSRMLLGMPMTDNGIDEATRYLARQPPDPQQADLYYWYYASLSMLHMQNPLWKDWNILTRESLIGMQQLEGPSAGSWETNIKWGDRGGKVFTTALATLTLEVYYRYLPMRKSSDGKLPETKQ